MMNFDRIAMLLHLHEKLWGLPHLSPILAHVDAELKNHAHEASKEPVPGLKEAEEEAAAKAEAMQKEEAAREAEQRLDAEKSEEEAKRLRHERDEKALANRPNPDLIRQPPDNRQQSEATPSITGRRI